MDVIYWEKKEELRLTSVFQIRLTSGADTSDKE